MTPRRAPSPTDSPWYRSEVALNEVWEEGRRAHPGIDLALAELERHLAERPVDERPVAHPADLYLACACLVGVAGAVERFQATYLERVPAYLGTLARGRDFVAEVQQALAIRLLVGHDGKPRLADYAGRGSLEGWVRIAATRLAIDLLRVDESRENLAAAVEEQLVEGDHELGHLRTAYRGPFREAFAQALGEIEGAQRSLLRLHYVEGMTTAALAGLHKVSRATIIRRVAGAREAILALMGTKLRERLGLQGEELDSLLRLMRSQLDVSVERLLCTTLGPR